MFLLLGVPFSETFPDCAIAKTFACGPTKSSYVCTHGLAPHFKHLSKKLSAGEEDYVLHFDERLNRKKTVKAV